MHGASIGYDSQHRTAHRVTRVGGLVTEIQLHRIRIVEVANKLAGRRFSPAGVRQVHPAHALRADHRPSPASAPEEA
jgi:hypothetical protein